MSDGQIVDKRVVIERRGDSPLEWSTEDGLAKLHMTPFGVIGEFEGKERVTQIVSWMDVTDLSILDLNFGRDDNPGPIQTCEDCGGSGLTDPDTRCVTCEGWGHLGRDR